MLVNLYLAECAMGLEPHLTRSMQVLRCQGRLAQTSYEDIIRLAYSRYRRGALIRLRVGQAKCWLISLLILIGQIGCLAMALLADALLFGWLTNTESSSHFGFLLSCVSGCLLVLGSVLAVLVLASPLERALRTLRETRHRRRQIRAFALSPNETRELGDLCYHWVVDWPSSPFPFRDELREKFAKEPAIVKIV